MSEHKHFDIFISYSRKDIEEVKEIKAIIEKEVPGIRCWFDLTGIESGEEFTDRIITAIDNSDRMLFMYSKNSVVSEFARKEIGYAKDENKKIILLLLQGTDLKANKWFKFNFGNLDCIDFYDDDQRDKLIRDLKRWLGIPIDKIEATVSSQPHTDDNLQNTSTVYIETDLPCRVFHFNEEVGMAYPDKDCILKLCRGNHKLKFVSVENEEDRITTKYTVEKVMVDFISVEFIPIRENRIAEERRIQEEEERKQKEEAERKRQEAEALARKAQAEAERKKSIHEGHTFVDLGLSVKWATCNVGATTPEEYGNYYAWGEIETKADYASENSKTRGKSLGDIGGNPGHDAARAVWGGSWRLPTKTEIEELKDNCKWKWTTQGGKNGCQVTSKINGKSIFLPAAGYRDGAFLDDDGFYGSYWSSAPSESDTDYACKFHFYSGGHDVNWDDRDYEFSVRPVVE